MNPFVVADPSPISTSPTSAVHAAVPKQTPLAWLQVLLAKSPQFSIRTKRPGMANCPFPRRLGRNDTLKSLLGCFQHQLDVVSGDTPRTPLNAVVAAPGAGKTFLLGMFWDVSISRVSSFFLIS